MNITLTLADRGHAELFAQLMQLYAYDFSEHMLLDVGEDGRFANAPRVDYWHGDRYRPFLIRADQQVAGFSIVDSESRLTGEPLWDMSQFFVLRRYRRSGVGTHAARATFDTLQGRWEVRQSLSNISAQSFWRRVIGQYTSEQFQETVFNDETWRGPVQSFDTSRASTDRR